MSRETRTKGSHSLVLGWRVCQALFVTQEGTGEVTVAERGPDMEQNDGSKANSVEVPPEHKVMTPNDSNQSVV